MGIQQFNEVYPYDSHVVYVDATGTNIASVTSANLLPIRIDTLFALSDDTVDRTFNIYVQSGGNNNFIGSVVIPHGAGNAPVPLYEMLAPIFGTSMTGLALAPGEQIGVAAVVAGTNGKALSFHAFGGLLT